MIDAVVCLQAPHGREAFALHQETGGSPAEAEKRPRHDKQHAKTPCIYRKILYIYICMYIYTMRNHMENRIYIYIFTAYTNHIYIYPWWDNLNHKENPTCIFTILVSGHSEYCYRRSGNQIAYKEGVAIYDMSCVTNIRGIDKLRGGSMVCIETPRGPAASRAESK